MGIETFTSNTKALVGLAFVIGIGMTMIAQLIGNTAVGTAGSITEDATYGNISTANLTLQHILTGVSQFGTWIGLIVLIIVGVYLMKSMNKT